MRFLIILLCLKFMGILGYKLPSQLTINDVVAKETYRYYDNLESDIMCNNRGDESNNVMLKYIPPEGEPITTLSKTYYNTMIMKLTSENHNGTLECHITGKENLTLSTRLENIEILKASGLYESNEVVHRFQVNGELLRCREGGRLDKNDPHNYVFTSFDNETLYINFLKKDGENASCELPHKSDWGTSPNPFTDYKNFTYKLLFKDEYSTFGMACTIYKDHGDYEIFTLRFYTMNEYDRPPIKGLPKSKIIMSYQVDQVNSKCTEGKNTDALMVLLEYGRYTMTCTHSWCYDESQVECLERTDENLTPNTCTFRLKDGHSDSIVKCPANEKSSDNYIKLIKKDQVVVAF